jgi:hypothetical protein
VRGRRLLPLGRSRTPKEEVMSVMSALSHLVTEYRAARSRYLTERQVRSLPFEIQKDIGWPDARGTGSDSSLSSWPQGR